MRLGGQVGGKQGKRGVDMVLEGKYGGKALIGEWDRYEVDRR